MDKRIFNFTSGIINCLSYQDVTYCTSFYTPENVFQVHNKNNNKNNYTG